MIVDLNKPTDQLTVAETDAIVRKAMQIVGRRGGAPLGNKNAKGNRGGSGRPASGVTRPPKTTKAPALIQTNGG